MLSALDACCFAAELTLLAFHMLVMAVMIRERSRRNEYFLTAFFTVYIMQSVIDVFSYLVVCLLIGMPVSSLHILVFLPAPDASMPNAPARMVQSANRRFAGVLCNVIFPVRRMLLARGHRC